MATNDPPPPNSNTPAQRVSRGELVESDDPATRALMDAHTKAVVADRSINERVNTMKAEIDAANADTMRRVVVSKEMMDAIMLTHPDDETLRKILIQLVQENADNLVKTDRLATHQRIAIAMEDIREKAETEPVIRATVSRPQVDYSTELQEAREANRELRERLEMIHYYHNKRKPTFWEKLDRSKIPAVIVIVGLWTMAFKVIPTNFITVPIEIGVLLWMLIILVDP